MRKLTFTRNTMLHVFFPTCQRPQSGNRVSTSLSNSGLCWTVFARNRDTAVSAEGNSDLQTLICVLVARPRWCPTLSNPVPWQNWMAAYLGYTLWMKSLFRARPVMVHDTHTGRRTAIHCYIPGSLFFTWCYAQHGLCHMCGVSLSVMFV